MPPSLPPRPPTLLEALRRLLADEGQPPSRSRLAALIEAGAARVDGRVVRDPEHVPLPEARLSLDLDDVPESLPRRRPARPARAALPQGVLFADAQLVVAERAAFQAQDGAAFAAAVAAALGRERLWFPRDPAAPGAGPVLLAGSDAARRTLEGAIEAGRVLETLLSVRSPPQAGPGEVVLERGSPGPGRPAAPFGLVRREQAPLAPPPLGGRTLLPSQRLALTLKHPRTNRRLAFEVGAAPSFLEALVGLGLVGEGG